ncbi:MAG: carboxypeptidase regulatory-like domain-containing protein, partial [Planctomycetota bacterium]
MDRLRSEARRERAAARPEHVPPTHELADRLARHRMVRDAVLALDEPFRETVLLRFYEDLPPRRISETLGIPVATVKSRLRRAFDLPRKELRRTHGSAWCVALLPLLTPRTLAATVAGGFDMKKLAGIIVVLALLGTGWVVVRSNRAEEPTRRTDESPATEQAPYKVSAPLAQPEKTTEPPEKQRPTSTRKPKRPNPALVVEESGNPDRSALRVQVVDTSGRALSDVAVGVTLSVDNVGTAGPRGKTDAAGRVSFDDLRADQVIATHAEVGDLHRSARVRLTDGKVSELKFTMPSGIGVRGTIRDVDSGPIGFVMVALSRDVGGGFTDRAYGHTDKEGIYTIDGVPPGSYKMAISGGPSRSTVTVTTDGVTTKTSPPPRRIQYHERDQGELIVALPGPIVKNIELGRLSIEGIVRDGATGEALPGVKVNLQSPHWASTTTNERGRFSVASMAPGNYSIMLKKDGYVIKWVKEVEITKNDVTRVEFTVERGARLTVQLRDPHGKPVGGEHWFQFEFEEHSGWSSNLIADAEGNAVSKVVPLGKMNVSVSGAGWQGGPVEAEIKPGDNQVVVPVKRTAGSGVRSLSGVVRDKKTGAPVVGV